MTTPVDIETLSATVTQLSAQFEKLSKFIAKAHPDFAKMLKGKKVRKPAGERKTNPNSGFLKPVNVEPALAEFLKIKPDEKISRVDITKAFTSYIKEHKLQDPSNGRVILPDPTMKKLLKPEEVLKDGKPLTYFSLQSVLNPLIKKDPKVEKPAEKK